MECLECVALWTLNLWEGISRFVVIEKAPVKVERPHGQVRISHVPNVQHLVFLEDNFNMNQESVAYRAREFKDSSSKKQNTIQVPKVYKYQLTTQVGQWPSSQRDHHQVLSHGVDVTIEVGHQSGDFGSSVAVPGDPGRPKYGFRGKLPFGACQWTRKWE